MAALPTQTNDSPIEEDLVRKGMHFIIVALVALALQSARAVAQTDTAATSIRKEAVTAFRDHPNAARGAAVSSRPLVLDPVVWPTVFEHGIGIQRQSPATPVVRDSAQSVMLALALGGTVADSAEIRRCGEASTPPRAASDQCNLTDVVIVAVGEPRPAASEVSLMMRTTAPVRLANGSFTQGRYGSNYLVRLHRVDGRWRVRCLTNVAADSDMGVSAGMANCPPPGVPDLIDQKKDGPRGK